MRGLSTIAILWSGVACADGLPAIYSVVGVSTEDVLNVRSEPDAGAYLVGSIEPEAEAVEVVGVSANGWGLVNSSKGSGWVNMRFLALETPFSWPQDQLFCFGTEPFWDAEIGETRNGPEIRLGNLDGESIFGAAVLNSSANLLGRYSAFAAATDGSNISAFIRREQCSDGMSDRAYGLSIDIIARNGEVHVSGCCSLTAP